MLTFLVQYMSASNGLKIIKNVHSISVVLKKMKSAQSKVYLRGLVNDIPNTNIIFNKGH